MVIGHGLGCDPSVIIDKVHSHQELQQCSVECVKTASWRVREHFCDKGDSILPF